MLECRLHLDSYPKVEILTLLFVLPTFSLQLKEGSSGFVGSMGHGQ